MSGRNSSSSRGNGRWLGGVTECSPSTLRGYVRIFSVLLWKGFPKFLETRFLSILQRAITSAMTFGLCRQRWYFSHTTMCKLQICITRKSIYIYICVWRELEQIGTTRKHIVSFILRGKVTESSIWPMNRPANDHRCMTYVMYRMSHINRAQTTDWYYFLSKKVFFLWQNLQKRIVLKI